MTDTSLPKGEGPNAPDYEAAPCPACYNAEQGTLGYNVDADHRDVIQCRNCGAQFWPLDGELIPI